MLLPLLLLHASGYILGEWETLQAPDEQDQLTEYLESNLPTSTLSDLPEDILLNSDFNEDIPVFSSLETNSEMMGTLNENSSLAPFQVLLTASLHSKSPSNPN